MTTKTEYREYIASEPWQKRRKEFLLAYPRCNRCDIPRWLAVVAYDQDLHVHHRNYARVGQEIDDDLEPLCKRCHELETFGHSYLHVPRSEPCCICLQEFSWVRVDGEAMHQPGLCSECSMILAMCIGNFDGGRMSLSSLSPAGDPIESIRRELDRVERRMEENRKRLEAKQ